MTSDAATSVAGAAGVSLVAGTVLGLSVATLAAGFFGGLVALGVMPKLPGAFARVISVAASTITATFLAPYAAGLMHVGGIETLAELQAAAFFIGLGAQALLPAAISAAKRRIEQLGGSQPQ